MRSLPQNIEAEKYLLSAVLRQPKNMDDVVSVVSSDDFFVPEYRIVFNGILNLWNDGKPIDALLVKSYLEKVGLLEQAGGALGIIDLLEEGSKITNAIYYAEQVAEKARLRKCIQIGESLVNKAFLAEQTSTEIVEELDTSLLEIVNRNRAEIYDAQDMMTIVYESAKKAFQVGRAGLETGFNSIDHFLTGLEGGQSIIIAGRPSTGKTTLGMNIVENVARQGTPCLVFSVEMSVLGLGRRLLAKNSMVDSRKIKKGNLNESDWKYIYDVAEKLSQLPLYVSDVSGLSTVQMRSIARQAHRKYKIGMIMIDYVQLMRTAKRHDMRNVEVTEISSAIKALAKELNVPVLLLSQLSRASDKRGNGAKPCLSDLRDSGALEQDADAVIFTHRPDKVGQRTVSIDNVDVDSENVCELIIAKTRDGETGSRFMRFDGQHNKFYEIDNQQSFQRQNNYTQDDDWI